jgi:hypothetical protein
MKKQEITGYTETDQDEMFDDLNTVARVKIINQLDDDLFEQIGLFYHLSMNGKHNQIDYGTVSRLTNFSYEADLICALLDLHTKGDYEKTYKAFRATILSEKVIVDDLHIKSIEKLIKINSRIEMLERKTGTKVRFGNSFMIYVVLVIFIMNLFSTVSAEYYCGFKPNI